MGHQSLPIGGLVCPSLALCKGQHEDFGIVNRNDFALVVSGANAVETDEVTHHRKFGQLHLAVIRQGEALEETEPNDEHRLKRITGTDQPLALLNAPAQALHRT